MVELKPISTLTGGGCTDHQYSSSNNSASSSSPKLPSPTSLLPSNFPLATPPLLPHILYPPAFQNYPVHDQGFYFPYFPLQPPYYDNFIYYPNPPLPNYFHHHPDYYFYPHPQPQQQQPFPAEFHSYDYSACYGGGLADPVEVAPPPPDEKSEGVCRRIWRKLVGSGGPRNLYRHGRRNNGVKKQWKPKDQSSSSSSSSSAAPLPPPPGSPPPSPRTALGNCTTLMIKNIPNHISRKSLINMLETHCREQNQEQQAHLCRSEFDFLYLPFDFRFKKNLGYAFVNFTTVEGALRLYSCWNEKGWDGCVKIREITSARLQGRERCKKHFQISMFNCHSEEYLPVLFSPARDGLNSSDSRMSTVGKRIYRAMVGTA